MEIKSPWTMVWSENINEFIAYITENLPSNHELLNHDLYPGIKINGELIFIVDDDTTGKSLLIDFKNGKKIDETGLNVPIIKIFGNEEIQEMIERDHQTELNQYKKYTTEQFNKRRS